MMVIAHIFGVPVEELLASSAGAMTVTMLLRFSNIPRIALKHLHHHCHNESIEGSAQSKSGKKNVIE